MANYELWLTDDQGRRIADSRGHSYLKQFISLICGRSTNSLGQMTLQLPKSFDTSLLAPDRMIQVWRQPTGGRLGLWRVYFIRRWRFQTSGSNELITLYGPDINDLLRRRITAAFSGVVQATKTTYADDMMKAIVTESLADGVSPVPTAGTRAWPNLSVAGNLSAGPSMTKSFSFDPLLTISNSGTLPVIANAAKAAGTEVWFDIVPNVVTGSTITFQFVTYTGQPGMDVTDRVVFDQQRGNMKDPDLEFDYTSEVNYIYAAGQGEGTSRLVSQVYSAARYGQSIWNRCEGLCDARNEPTAAGVIASGNSTLDDGRPIIKFTATPVDTVGTRFGIDWNFGDKVRARYQNIEFDTIIKAVTITVNSDGEDIAAKLEYQS
jgi:hypothetical protein